MKKRKRPILIGEVSGQMKEDFFGIETPLNMCGAMEMYGLKLSLIYEDEA